MIQSRSYPELCKILQLSDPSVASCEANDLSQRLINEVKNGDELFFKNLANTPLRYRLRYLNLIYLATQISETAVEINFPNWFTKQLWQEQEEQNEREISVICDELVPAEAPTLTINPNELQKSNLKIRIPKSALTSKATQRDEMHI